VKYLPHIATAAVLAVPLALLAQAPKTSAPAPAVHAAVATVPGMPPVHDAKNLYSEIAAGKLKP